MDDEIREILNKILDELKSINLILVSKKKKRKVIDVPEKDLHSLSDNELKEIIELAGGTCIDLSKATDNELEEMISELKNK